MIDKLLLLAIFIAYKIGIISKNSIRSDIIYMIEESEEYGNVVDINFYRNILGKIE